MSEGFRRPSVSRKILMNYLKRKGELSDAQIIAYENRYKLGFGPRSDAISFMQAQRIGGIVRYDVERKVYIMN